MMRRHNIWRAAQVALMAALLIGLFAKAGFCGPWGCYACYAAWPAWMCEWSGCPPLP